jgi:hypothetical protein
MVRQSASTGLTIHSSRSRFAARLNSGVRALSDMFARLLFATTVLLISGCASRPVTSGPPELITHLRELAGPEAIECGMSPLWVRNPMEHQRIVVQCAEGAIANSKPFWAAFQQLGDDSALWEGVALTPGGQLMSTNYDSDIWGGSRSFVVPQSSDRQCNSVGFGDGQYGIVICRVGP